MTKNLAGLLLSVLVAISSFAQNSDNQTITGKIYDEKTGVGLPGATVHLKGTTHEVVTDKDGYFRFLTGQHLPVTILVSYVGYQKREVVETRNRNIDISLAPTGGQLNDVVVVGYGTQRRKDLTSAIATVKAAEVVSTPVASLDAQLQGKAAGLQINSNTGVPGDGIFVRVRGTTSINADNNPLYIIDGVFVNNSSLQTVNTGGRSTSPLADINPADIENIEVLKDASATAIYGSRGANGVVIVTTKRGNYNAPSRLNLDVSTGAAWAPKLWDLTTGPQHAQLVNEFYSNSYADAVAAGDAAGISKYKNPPFSGSVLNPGATTARGTPDLQKTYDRLHEIFRTGNLQNYNLSLSGGNKDTKYYIGGGYTRQDAILKPLYFDRINFKLNLDQRVSDKVQVGISNSFSRTFRNQGRSGDGPQGGLLQAALHTPTYLPETNADGTPARWAGFDNLRVLIDNYDVHTTSLRYIGNLYLDAELFRGLKFRSTFSLDYDNYNEGEYWNNLTQLGAAPTNGLATSAITQFTTWINEQTLSYRRLAGRHTFGILVGNTIQSALQTTTSAQGSGFPSNSWKDISSAATRTSGQTWTKGTLASFFTRWDYNYAGKYYVELSARADGSSKFGVDNQWGYFPSVGVSWRAKEEEFLRSVGFLSDLKLRASYGLTGNQNGISNFAAQGLWSGGYGYPDGSTGDQPGTAPQQLGNKNLKWESTSQANVGVDLGLFQGRISVDFNLYYKYTSNVLLQLPIQSITGFTSQYSNAGEISNKGYELSINTVNIRNGEFSWQTNFNIAGNVNKVEKLPTPIYQYNRNWIIMQQGSPMYSFWLYKQLYVDAKTGASVFEGQAANGSLPVSARQVLHNAMPKFFGGISNTVSWKGFDLNVLFAYQSGSYTYNLNKFFGEGGGTRDANRVLFADQLNRWQKPGDQTSVPRLTAYGSSYTVDQNSRFLEDASFIRLKSLTFGYTIPRRLTTRFKLETVRFYFVGTNLLLLTHYTGPDPEANVTGIQTIQGLDLGTPPQPRSVQFGLNVTL